MFTFCLKEKNLNNSQTWQRLTSGKFWASGLNLWTVGKESKYVPRESLDQTGQKNDGYFGVWDLARLSHRSYDFFPDDYLMSYHSKPDSLKPCLLHCMQNFLDKDSQEFLISSYQQALAALQTHCGSDFWHAFMFLTGPGYSVGLHRHDIPEPWPRLSFTYVISSGDGPVKTSYSKTIIENKQIKQVIPINFPNSKQFFMVHNSSYPHGAQSSQDDKNTYLYFIFDGVTPKSHITLDTFYEST